MDNDSLPNIAYTKIVQSGDLLEIYDYEKEPYFVREREKRIYRPKAQREAEAKLKREKNKNKTRYFKARSTRNVKRAKNNFRRMVRASLSRGAPALATLTMVSITSLEAAYKCFSRFSTNLRKSYGPDIAWVGVPEFQKRGAVHFHVLIWGLSHETIDGERNTRDLEALWSRGWLDIRKSDGSPKIASYMAKYMSKTMHDDRLFGAKSYTASRNCLRPVSFNTGTSVAYLEEAWPEIRAVDNPVDKFEVDKVYKTEWLGRCRYRKLVTKIVKKDEGNIDV